MSKSFNNSNEISILKRKYFGILGALMSSYQKKTTKVLILYTETKIESRVEG